MLGVFIKAAVARRFTSADVVADMVSRPPPFRLAQRAALDADAGLRSVLLAGAEGDGEGGVFARSVHICTVIRNGRPYTCDCCVCERVSAQRA